MAYTAVEKVFDTPELLEHILQQMDMASLLRAQRLSRSINAVISNNSVLQAKLFFKTSSRPHEDTAPIEANSLLLTCFAPLFPSPATTSESTHRRDYRSIFDVFRSTLGDTRVEIMQAVLGERAPRRGPPSIHEPPEVPASPAPNSTPDFVSYERRRKAFLRKDASWRRMLTHQPPVSRVNMTTISSGMGGRRYRRGYRSTVTDDPLKLGLRMGQLYDMAVTLALDVDASYFGLRYKVEHSPHAPKLEQRTWLSITTLISSSCVINSNAMRMRRDVAKEAQSEAHQDYRIEVARSYAG